MFLQSNSFISEFYLNKNEGTGQSTKGININFLLIITSCNI